ncbi:MAG: ATP-binding protein, partial [Acidobacteria bacterium]|nr:ATP-binding protein [Acidobacteriota bacterium]
MNDTSKLRARIHDSAIERVTRMFAATLSDIFSETLQNARRAGATRVRVQLREIGEDSPPAIVVSDDGAGIADPAVLLSFGENGWSEDLVRREDAAGMGFLSLARRGCAVSSRPRARHTHPVPGWRVELAPEHFLGEAEAAVDADDAAPFPHGTAV